MAHDPPNQDFQRARSDAQKQERRRDILDAARAHLTEAGFDGFSLGPLARAVGVARGTLYLYFRTREEVLLALYLEELRAWLEELESITEPKMGAEAFLRAVFTSATARTAFMELAPRVTGVLESHVEVESLIESKRLSAVLVEVAGRQTSLALALPAESGGPIAVALFALLIGVTQTMGVPHRGEASLPPDVQELLLAGESAEAAFLRIGRWIVDGASVAEAAG